MKNHKYCYFECENCHDIGRTRIDIIKENNIRYCKSCELAPTIQFYMCDDCGKAVEIDNYGINKLQNSRCRSCTSRRLAKYMQDTRSPDYHKKAMESFEYNSIGRNSLVYGLYELGYADKELGGIIGLGSSGVANWRWKRNLLPNFEETEKLNKDGTFKSKNIKGSRDIYTHVRDGLSKWKYNIMKQDKFVCQICGGTKDKEVHHNKETFMNILKKFLPNREIEKGLTWEEKKKIANKIVKYHYDNNVSGITLCGSCHRWIHNLNPLDFQ